jgi:hypothetical protein
MMESRRPRCNRASLRPRGSLAARRQDDPAGSDRAPPQTRWRGAGIYDALFRARLAQASTLRPRMRATVSDYAAGTFRRYGFTVVGKRGRFTVFEKAADTGAAPDAIGTTLQAA